MSKHQVQTIITLTLPGTPHGLARQGQADLLIQRGPLAHLTQVHYHSLTDLGQAIYQAEIALVALEIDPPNLTEANDLANQHKPLDPLANQSDPTIDATSTTDPQQLSFF